ncbi:basic-leucine zipper domain-containing protein [Artemisia annua]|uniref:Basic-leucine zipper domain-containing protein n=1 Tax=Artemisia annua TaxID=35608 RepID=A0A2U1Q1K1_ARTAN|nr:basic-leucine zipper domain-containing protein [Artemisia annua]
MSENEEGHNPETRHSNTGHGHFRAQFRPCLNNENGGKRVGMPPLSPTLQTDGLQNLSLGTGPSHSRTLSQPLFFGSESLPPLSPSMYRENVSGPFSDHVVGDVSLPPRKTHRRSNSDIPFGFSTILQSSPPLISLRGTSVKRESGNVEGMGERKCEGEVDDDMFNAYINLTNLGRLNTFRAENGEDLDSRASGTKANGGDSSDNEATSSVIGSGTNNMHRSGVCSVSDKREGIKRSAGGDIAPTTRHYRSVSMDSVMGKMNFMEESLKLPPSPGGQMGKIVSGDSVDPNADTFSLEFGNGVFNEAELKKIMANENLAEMALTDPKRVKRILANRQSAARSKERKMRYITELENKVQTLQNEATALSAQLTLLQRDQTNLTSQNSELKFRLQAMEQQAQLRDALNDALTTEVQRLKLMAMELNGDATNFSQLSIGPQVFQLHHQQVQQSQQQNGGAAVPNE